MNEYDIADLGHTIKSVTGTYARSTLEALEHAVNRLTEPERQSRQFMRHTACGTCNGQLEINPWGDY